MYIERAMIYRLSEFAQSAGVLHASLDAPVLLWEAPTAGGRSQLKKPDAHIKARRRMPTERGIPIMDEADLPPLPAVAKNEPLVLQILKTLGSVNAFAMGVTVGRIDTNDIMLDDPTVSRFHAWFDHERASGWGLVDASSIHGTWIGSVRVQPGLRTLIPDQTPIRFGGVEVVFLLARTLLERVLAGEATSRNR